MSAGFLTEDGPRPELAEAVGATRRHGDASAALWRGDRRAAGGIGRASAPASPGGFWDRSRWGRAGEMRNGANSSGRV
jgi:hypothetical protein